MRKISRSTPYGDLADGGAAAVVSWLALDAVFPSEIIASRPTEKLPGPRSWYRSSRHVADAFYTAERIRVRGKSEGKILRHRVWGEIPCEPQHLYPWIIRGSVIEVQFFDCFTLQIRLIARKLCQMELIACVILCVEEGDVDSVIGVMKSGAWLIANN